MVFWDKVFFSLSRCNIQRTGFEAETNGLVEVVTSMVLESDLIWFIINADTISYGEEPWKCYCFLPLFLDCLSRRQALGHARIRNFM